MEIFTLGYEGLALERFLEILVEHEIEVLVDVREKPLSRKSGFSKVALTLACQGRNIGYQHVQKLGCPNPIRDEYRESGDWVRYTGCFLEHLEMQSEEVEAVAALGKEARICLVCFEADFNLCHRSFIAEAISRVEVCEVRHLNRNSLPSGQLALL